ncbi:(2,3-dihydroxybenzoyl)adenylate synthase [Streptomyces sp. NPDC057686]|uniref:(2,3-dihydroxybenzoyl)adenylate synthase n=1 Tax=Streptomyces sp. NPDC057686 TaxID=3346212 RepID=UPI0036AF776D
MTPWPDSFANRYRRAGHWRDKSLGELLRSSARNHAAAPALRWEDRCWSYGELDSRSDRMAAGLLELGITPGDRVVVQLPNVPVFFALLFGLFRLGAVPVFALPSYRRNEIVDLCRITEATAYVVPATDAESDFDYRVLAGEVVAQVPSLRHVLVAGDPGHFTALADIDAEPRQSLAAPASDQLALLLASGGTTGVPKLIPRTHNDYFYLQHACAELCALTPASVYLAVLPIGHQFALACPGVLGTFYKGGTVALSPSPRPRQVFEAIERFRVTITSAVPPLAMLWAQAAAYSTADLTSLEVLQVGGARLPEEAARTVNNAFGGALQQVYGMSEGLLSLTRRDDPPQTVLSTQGLPLSPDDELRVVDDSDNEVEPGMVGRLLVRGPYTVRGYFRSPEYNRTAFTDDGFYRTGDLVRLTPAGRIVVEGREKDLVNRAGVKISTEEVQDHLRSHPAIADAALIPLPDALMGERACACIVLRDGYKDVPDLAEYLRQRGLATYKTPDTVRVFDSLPLTSIGKIDKRELIHTLTQPQKTPTTTVNGSAPS